VVDYGMHRALDGLNLEIPSSGVFGLLGRNGAGKTTNHPGDRRPREACCRLDIVLGKAPEPESEREEAHFRPLRRGRPRGEP